MEKRTYHIQGMHCRSCELLIENNIAKISGVERVSVNYKKGVAWVEYGHEPASDEPIAQAVRDAGYSLGKGAVDPFLATDQGDYFVIVFSVAIIFLLYLAARITGVADLVSAKFSSAPTYPIVFVIGLTAGVSTCMALVGGLVAGFSAAYAQAHQQATRWERFVPNLYFNASRLASYAFLGGVVGAVGSVAKISAGATGILLAGAGIVMMYVGLKLAGISPRLSHSSITLPKKISRLFGATDARGEYSHWGAVTAGALTFFLPCGFTQAMQLYAMTSGNAATGAAIMFFFALGTTPGLLGIGGIAAVLRGGAAKLFFRFVGVVVVILGIVNVSNGYALSGLTINVPFLGSGQQNVSAGPSVPIENGVQVVTMTQSAGGYSPNQFTIKKGIPVRWVIDSEDAYSCAASIRMPAFGIAQFLQSGTNTISFTPAQAGTIRFTCGMGMYSGTFTVVD